MTNTTISDKRLNELLSRDEIRTLLATYSMAGDRADYAAMASVFTEDGVLDGASHRVGREEIIASLAKRPISATGPSRAIAFSRHCLTTSMITFDDEVTAKGRTYFVVCTDTGLDHFGVYIDRFACIDGRWFIRHRNVRIDWVAENGHAQVTRPSHKT